MLIREVVTKKYEVVETRFTIYPNPDGDRSPFYVAIVHRYRNDQGDLEATTDRSYYASRSSADRLLRLMRDHNIDPYHIAPVNKGGSFRGIRVAYQVKRKALKAPA